MFGLWSVIERELRAQSRSPATFWLRIVTAGLAIFIGAYLSFTRQLDAGKGSFLFLHLHWLLQLFIWIAIPLMAADCISKERREGTLALLFLTPLRPWHIIVAKVWVYGLRAASISISLLPVMSIAVVLGGVSPSEIVNAICLNGCSIILAISASILGSVVAKSWSTSLFLSISFSISLFLVLSGFLGLTYLLLIPIGYRSTTSLFYGLEFLLNLKTIPQRMSASALVTAPVISLGGYSFHGISFSLTDLTLLYSSFLFSMVVLLGSLAVSTKLLKWFWKETPPSARLTRIENTLLKPVVAVGFLKRWLKRTLDRNPVGWLELRSWSGRSLSWGWFAVMISVYTFLLEGDRPQYVSVAFQSIVSYGFLAVVAGNASGSFYRERENGAMELLLVSPLTAAEIMLGRLRAIWSRFLPALVVLIALWLYLPGKWPEQGDMARMGFIVSSYLFLPVVGIYYSLRCSNFIASFACVLLVGFLMPMFGFQVLFYGTQLLESGRWNPRLFNILFSQGTVQNFESVFSCFLQSMIAIYLAKKLYKKLNQREIGFIRKASM